MKLKKVEFRTKNLRGETTQVLVKDCPIVMGCVSVNDKLVSVKKDGQTLYVEELDDTPDWWDPIQPLDAEFERFMTFWVQHRDFVREKFQASRVIFNLDKDVLHIQKDPFRVIPTETIRR